MVAAAAYDQKARDGATWAITNDAANSRVKITPVLATSVIYRKTTANDVVSSVYGRLSEPRQLDEPPKGSPLAALIDSLDSVIGSLRFTKEGVATSLEIRRH